MPLLYLIFLKLIQMTRSSPWLELAKKQVIMFQNDNVNWMETFVMSDCIKSIMEVSYKILVREKIFPPIEDMDIEDKRNVWLTAGEFAKGRLDDLERAKVCKGLLALEYLLK